MKYYVLAYKTYSNAAKTIARLIGAKRIKLQGSKWKPKLTRIVINWGNTAPPLHIGNQVLNSVDATQVAVNKLTALQKLREAGVKVPTFTSSKDEARNWFDREGTVVFCRTLLRASGGKGIVIAEHPDQLVNAPLYTKRVKKSEEYRIHVFNEQVIDVVKKKLRMGLANNPNRNLYVRNHDNGWIFAHDGVACPEEVKQAAVNAVKALGLTFGAVDIGVTKKGTPFVFEVNTAPGLENQQTIQAYVQALNNYKKKEEEKYNANLQQRNFIRREY